MKRILIFSFILILLLSACNSDGSGSPEQTIPSLTPEEIIAQASPQLDELSSFHFKLSQKGGGTPIAMSLEMTGVEGDIVPPNKLRMLIEATWSGQFMEAGLITVDTMTYMTNPLTGKWEVLSDNFNAVTLFQPDTGIKAVMESATDLVLLEPEKVDGALCFHMGGMLVSDVLDAIAVGHSAEGLPVEVEIWIGVDDFLLRKVVFDGRICEKEKDGIVRTLELSKFNEPVTIEVPE